MLNATTFMPWLVSLKPPISNLSLLNKERHITPFCPFYQFLLSFLLSIWSHNAHFLNYAGIYSWVGLSAEPAIFNVVVIVSPLPHVKLTGFRVCSFTEFTVGWHFKHTARFFIVHMKDFASVIFCIHLLGMQCT